ncbi:MAG: serine hydrolase [Pseudomonadota bacterium]
MPATLPLLPKQPENVPWPTNDWPTAPLASDVNGVRLQHLLDFAFSQPEELGRTHAVLAIQGGRLVIEHYGNGHTADETYPSWSMAKSMTHALAGFAIQDGALELSAPITAPEWRGEGDARAPITLDDLLRMSSGLRFREEYQDAGVSDTIEMLFGAGKADTAHFAASQPLVHAPGSHWLYSSGTTNIIARCVAAALGLDRDGFKAFMTERLFSPIGISSAIPKFDEAGTFIGSSFCFCTPRDFARFGLLYLRGGYWDGAQLLEPSWVDHARTPSPNVPESEPMGYGGHWWLNIAGEGSFSANGYDGQYIVLVPGKDLILVRHGASELQKDEVRAWLKDVADCF